MNLTILILILRVIDNLLQPTGIQSRLAQAARRADLHHREEVGRLGQDMRRLSSTGDPLGEEAQARGRNARAGGLRRQPRQEDRGEGRQGEEDERPPALGARETRERHPGIKMVRCFKISIFETFFLPW